MLMGDDIMENLATIAFIFFPLAAFMLQLCIKWLHLVQRGLFGL